MTAKYKYEINPICYNMNDAGPYKKTTPDGGRYNLRLMLLIVIFLFRGECVT